MCSVEHQKIQADKAAKKCNTLVQKMFVHAIFLANVMVCMSMACISEENSMTRCPMNLHICSS